MATQALDGLHPALSPALSPAPGDPRPAPGQPGGGPGEQAERERMTT
ncbi:hypothetical protein ACIBIZ_16870 [Nonomuraea spiralis]|nr:hypothetical protein [Nonomuraea sp. WAC 01424]